MHISGVSFAFPQRTVSNEEMLQIVADQSREGFQGDLNVALQTIEHYLNYIGSKNRHWLAEGEQAFTYTERAINEALDQAGLEKDDIDLLIHASVDKRVIEPAMAFFVAKAMGMHKTQCFDVTEACGSWTRATQIAQAFLASGEFKNVLIVTAEYASHEGQPLAQNHKLTSLADLEWAFASYTVGEGSTATVLTADDQKPWQFDNRTFTQYADLCMSPIIDDDLETMRLKDLSMAGKGRLRFMSYGKKMQDNTIKDLEEMMRENPIPVDEVDLFIPHTNTLTAWRDLEKRLGKKVPYLFMLPEYGNLVTNSVPAALATAQKEGRLERGHKVTALMTAAGMSYTRYNFVY
ncbi:MAG TPA: 3-oxoacyl-[acyl-carrier-protein] synthase III C-terminal domain-containing protein [Aquabacterium sp.]|nr:3-oxoacyl-[acyl-carrier-protein] synthase III C-terminal domain-containing protein [Aquabacterium sp.]